MFDSCKQYLLHCATNVICKMCKCKSCFLICVLVLVLQYSTKTEGVRLKITTSPPGPVYMASSWIRFECKATNYSRPEIVRYEWRGFSSDTRETETLFVDDPLLDGDRSAFIWILSTSNVQYVECHVTNGSSLLLTTGMEITVTGAGVRFENEFLSNIANNTAVVNTGNNEYTLLCQSALRNSCNAGNWNAPGNSNVTSSHNSQVCSTFEQFSTVQLSLSPDLVSGLYTCAIPDETLLTRKVLIGIYSDLEERVTPFKSSMMLTHAVDSDNKLLFSCSTKALPSSLAVWRRDNIILSPSATVSSRISVVNVTSALYDSELVMEWNGRGVSLVNCLVHSEWLLPGDSFYNPESASGNFLIIELGTSTSVQCTNRRNIAHVQWLNQHNQTLNTSLLPNLDVNGDAFSIVNATVSLSGASFYCRGEDANGEVKLWQHFAIIVSVPPDFTVVSLADNYTQPAIEDEPYNITCCHNTTDTTVPITIEWYQDRNKKIEMLDNPNFLVTVENQCSTLHFVGVSLEENGRNYRCRAETNTPLLYTESTTLDLHTTSVTLRVDEKIIVDPTTDYVDPVTAGATSTRSLPMSLIVVVLTVLFSIL